MLLMMLGGATAAIVLAVAGASIANISANDVAHFLLHQHWDHSTRRYLGQLHNRICDHQDLLGF